MRAKFFNITLFLLVASFATLGNIEFAEQPKGSRLYIKPVVKKKTLTFAKGKRVLAFKPNIGTIDVKQAKTVNLFFANYLINRNLSNPVAKESNSKKEPIFKTVSLANTETNTSETSAEAEPGEKLYSSESLIISNIYPNPADDAGFFDYAFGGNVIKEAKIEFFNVLGTSMNLTVVLDKFERKAKVNLKEFPNGIYFYQLNADGKTLATKKLLVRHFN